MTAMRKRGRSLALAVLGITLIAGCAQSASTPFPSASPSVSLAPSATAEPTEAPTPTANVGRDAEVAFLERLLEGNERLVELYEELVIAVNSESSAVDLQLAAREMSDWTDQERTWLLENQPEPCFEESWQAYLDVIEAYRTLGDLSQTAAANPQDQLATDTALAALDDAVEAHGAAAEALGTSTC
jgi:hypothetical protein